MLTEVALEPACWDQYRRLIPRHQDMGSVFLKFHPVQWERERLRLEYAAWWCPEETGKLFNKKSFR